MVKGRLMLAAAVAAVAFNGCASMRDDDAEPWTQADDRAIVQMGEQAPSPPPPPPPPPQPNVPRTRSIAADAGATACPAPLADAPDVRLAIYLFSIGQADSMLVVGPAPERKTLLVDLGEPTGGSHLPPQLDSSVAHVLRCIQAVTGENGVDYFVLTHYHSDHAGFGAGREEGWGSGIIRALSDFSLPFKVGEFIHVGADGAQFMAAESNRRVYRTVQGRMPLWLNRGRVVRQGPPRFGSDQIDLGEGVSVDVLAFAGKVPGGASAFDRAIAAGVDYSQTPGNENDLSIALEISAGDFELFTAGDLNGTDDPVRHPLFVVRDFDDRQEIYTNIEHHLVGHWESTGRESDVEVFRANHHGSSYSNTAKLLDALDPELILYSTGGDHGHPSNSVVVRGAETADQLATTWVTDLETFVGSRGKRVGRIDILVAADGRSYTVNGEEHRAFTDDEESAGDDEE